MAKERWIMVSHPQTNYYNTELIFLQSVNKRILHHNDDFKFNAAKEHKKISDVLKVSTTKKVRN